MTIPTCVVTGRIAGDSDACGDCDPCSADRSVPEAVRRLLTEKDGWRGKYGEAMAEIDQLNELLRGTGANRYWEGRWRDANAEITRLNAIIAGMTPASDVDPTAGLAP